MKSKPCPFCGAAAVDEKDGSVTIAHKHLCPLEEILPIRISAFMRETWNTRAPDPIAKKLADALREAAKKFREYQKIHEAKFNPLVDCLSTGDIRNFEKAAANGALANKFFAALAEYEKEKKP